LQHRWIGHGKLVIAVLICFHNCKLFGYFCSRVQQHVYSLSLNKQYCQLSVSRVILHITWNCIIKISIYRYL